MYSLPKQNIKVWISGNVPYVSSSEVMHSWTISLLSNILSDKTYMAALCSSGFLLVVVNSIIDTWNKCFNHCCYHYYLKFIKDHIGETCVHLMKVLLY